MERAYFEIKMNPVGRFYFVFRDSNGAVFATSKSFGGRAQLEKCVADIRETAPLAAVACSLEVYQSLPLFLVQKSAGGFQFMLIGYDGEIIFSSEQHAGRGECNNAVRILKEMAPEAAILDSV